MIINYETFQEDNGRWRWRITFNKMNAIVSSVDYCDRHHAEKSARSWRMVLRDRENQHKLANPIERRPLAYG